MYLSNQYINTPNGFVKPQIGSAAAAAVSYLCDIKTKTRISFSGIWFRCVSYFSFGSINSILPFIR
jgi:hypothetical protein